MDITREIFKRMEAGNKLIDIICELVEGSNVIDYHDVADIIKDNPTMMALLEQEFKKRRMIEPGQEEINLTNIFKEL
jgi:hypothetical protein